MDVNTMLIPAVLNTLDTKYIITILYYLNRVKRGSSNNLF